MLTRIARRLNLRIVISAPQSPAIAFRAPWLGGRTVRHHSSDMNKSIEVQEVEKDGQKLKTVTEGKATILVPQGGKIAEDKSEVQQVFYNPIQQFNRDLSVLAIKTFGEEVIREREAHFAARKTKQAEQKSKKRKRAEDESENKDEKQAPVESAPVESTPVESTPAETNEPPKQNNFRPSFKILDALSASGLRALRYAHELPFVTSVTANDLSKSASEAIKSNVEHNGLSDKIKVTNEDALAHMYRGIAEDLSQKDRVGNPGKAHKYDVVDLDPYGTGAPFFDAAVQTVRDDGGLLCITCTDSAIWAGHSYCEKSFALYGGIPVKGSHSHEAGLRLVLNAIASSAARYGLAIEPQLCLSIDFYVKFFVRMRKSQQAVKFLGSKSMLVYSCDSGCGSWQTQPLMRSRPTPNKKGDGVFYKHTMAQAPLADQNCRHCGFKTHLNGPMWGGRLHNPDFIKRLLAQIPQADPKIYGTLTRLQGMLQTALEEHLSVPGSEADPTANSKDAQIAEIDPYPFYILPGKMSGVVGCATPPEDLFRGAIIHLGYRVTRSHCKPGSIKTDAPFSTLWWIWAQWIRQRAPVKAENISPGSATFRLLSNAGIIGIEDGKVVSKVDGPKPPVEDAKNEDSNMEDVAAEKPSNGVEEGGTVLGEEELRKTLVFNEALARLGRQHGGERIMRYQVNPEVNWGPMARARGK